MEEDEDFSVKQDGVEEDLEMERAPDDECNEEDECNGEDESTDKSFTIPSLELPESSPLYSSILEEHTVYYTSVSHRLKRAFAPKMTNPYALYNSFRLLLTREVNLSGLGRFSPGEQCHLSQRYIPSDGPAIIDSMESRAYIGQFSNDGDTFVAGFQDRKIRLYNVSDGWKLRKDITAQNLRWTVTDTAITPDQKFLAYASINPIVHLVNISNSAVESVADVNDVHESLNFATISRRERVFGLWSLKFSSDGRELVAGSSDSCIYLYDVDANKPTVKLHGHEDDVNTVSFADSTFNLIISGSDDHLCKVWDRRTLCRKSKPVGILVGHTEGITHIHAKGDGIHFISNGKDQTIKLWDIRKMISKSVYENLPKGGTPKYRWDYRWMDYPGKDKNITHPHDCSLMTYRNHQVLQTLIRCYFSPIHSTGQRYIFTGSHDGFVYIYDVLSGALVTKLKFHASTIRDCSWHPYLPLLASVSWDGKVLCWDFNHGELPSPPMTTDSLPSIPIDEYAHGEEDM